MLKLRHLLLQNKIYYIILAIVIIFTAVRIVIPSKSVLNMKTNTITGKVTSIKYNGDQLTIIIRIKKREQVQCYYYFKTLEELNNIKRKLKLGQKIKITGIIKKVNNNTIHNTFSLTNYLKIKKINYLFTIKKLKIVDYNVGMLYGLKNLILNYLSYFKSGPYIKMLLLGDTSFVSNEIIDSFRENGISHLFAISGTQVTVLAEAVLKILNKYKIKEKRRYIIVNIFIFIYMLLTGSPPAILRAVLFFLLSSINKYNYFYISNINIFYLTLSITLIINPYYIYDLGFLYSYSISMALILCSKFLDNKNSFYQLLLTSIISFLVSVPITINNFYQLNFMSIIYNLFYVPFVNSILFPLSIMSIFFYPLDYILSFFIRILEKTSLIISKISLGKIIFPKIPIITYVGYFLLLLIIYKYRYKVFWIFLIVYMLFHYSIYNIFNDDYVYYFDIGQGDSSLIHFDNQNILIDTGGKNNENNKFIQREKKSIAINSLIPFLKSKGMKKITYLIISHGDYDHMGEAINLVNNFKVEKVIFNCGPYNDLEQELIKVLDKKHIKYYSCIKELNIDKNKLYFLQTKEYDNENDNSNVIYTELGGYKFMFMGDASVTTEKEILNKYNISNIDALKVGHHGSRTSSSKEFINEINPKYSIISVGKNNRYGHPNKEVLNNLDNSKIYRTDQDGSVMFKLKNNKLKIETCSP